MLLCAAEIGEDLVLINHKVAEGPTCGCASMTSFGQHWLYWNHVFGLMLKSKLCMFLSNRTFRCNEIKENIEIFKKFMQTIMILFDYCPFILCKQES
jgi:hypothetical protein